MVDQFVKRNVFATRYRARLSGVEQPDRPTASGLRRSGATTTRAALLAYRHKVTARASENIRMRRGLLPGQYIERRKDSDFRTLLGAPVRYKKTAATGLRYHARAYCYHNHYGPAKFRRHLRSDQSFGRIRKPGEPFSRGPSLQRSDHRCERRMAADHGARVSETEGRIMVQDGRFRLLVLRQ